MNKDQYGFREGLSTTLAVTVVVQKIIDSLENKQSAVGVFLDLSKAFDTLDHSILLYKLRHYGFRGISEKLIENYLMNRTQYVVINSHKSEMNTIKCGIPQGSILGPLLFILYINDIKSASSILKFIQFADDTSLFFSHNDVSYIFSVLNQELGNFHTWLKCNKLVLNLSTSNYIVFSNSKGIDLQNEYLRIDTYELERVDHTKCLGINIDESLTWKYHTIEICNKLARIVGIIYRLKDTLPENILMNIYNTLFLPHISYGNIIWANCAKV